MKENFNYKDIPQGYTHCLNTQCLRASECLRVKAGLLADESVPSFQTVNPVYVACREECRYFHPKRLIRYASGINNLFTDLPHRKAVRLKKLIHHQLGHNTYYRIYNQTRLIGPEEQAFIRESFIKEGIETEPVFNSYVEKYDFGQS